MRVKFVFALLFLLRAVKVFSMKTFKIKRMGQTVKKLYIMNGKSGAIKTCKPFIFYRNGNSELGAYLTINNIQQEDFNRKFMCLVSTPQVIDGDSKLVVQLQNDQRHITGTGKPFIQTKCIRIHNVFSSREYLSVN